MTAPRAKVSAPSAALSLYAALEDGVRTGLVHRGENGLEYHLTEKGRAYIEKWSAWDKGDRAVRRRRRTGEESKPNARKGRARKAP